MSKSDQPGIAAAERRPTMTARELIQKLQALDEKSLDLGVYVRPALLGGEYASIKDVSVNDPGHAIIHLDDDSPRIINGGTF